MENMTTKITSSYNNALDIKVVEGHFATNHSHINRYIDMTTLKSRRKWLWQLPSQWLQSMSQPQ